ncbi:MAG: glycosyltransferase family 9 protein [Janthinobacterium lividum]
MITLLPMPIAAHARSSQGTPPSAWPASVRKILCIRPDNLGDVLMTTPAMHVLRAAAPGRRLTLLASGSGAQAAPFVPDIDAVIRFDPPWARNDAAHDPAAMRAIIERLAAERFDAAVIFTVYSQNPLPAAMLCMLAGIPRRLAFCRENPYALLTDWAAETEPAEQVRHEAQRQLDLVAHVGARPLDDAARDMRFKLADADRRGLHAVLAAAGAACTVAATADVADGDAGVDTDGDARQPWIVLHPGATAASRRYPAERFAQVAAQLLRSTAYAKHRIFITGSRDEAPLVAQVCAAARAASTDRSAASRIVDLADRLSLGQLGALLEGAQLLISNNSGPVHIASALGTPVVDLYALTNPQHLPWRTAHRVLSHDVPCRWCYKSVCPSGHHGCLLGITVDQVVAAAHALLPPCSAAAAELISSTTES